jgi:hypothetical protein
MESVIGRKAISWCRTQINLSDYVPLFESAPQPVLGFLPHTYGILGEVVLSRLGLQ